MKLELHLIPRTSFGANLRNRMGAYRWRKLSQQKREEAGHRCQICRFLGSGKGDLHLHELWEYDDHKRIQKLTGFEVVCRDCHDVHHWGRSTTKANQNRIDQLLIHACFVNHCGVETWIAHVKEQGQLWL